MSLRLIMHLHKHQHSKLTALCVFQLCITPKMILMLPPPTRRMFIIMDAVFHEDLMYFSSNSELQGEYHHEIQIFDCDYHISMKGESRL